MEDGSADHIALHVGVETALHGAHPHRRRKHNPPLPPHLVHLARTRVLTPWCDARLMTSGEFRELVSHLDGWRWRDEGGGRVLVMAPNGKTFRHRGGHTLGLSLWARRNGLAASVTRRLEGL